MHNKIKFVWAEFPQNITAHGSSLTPTASIPLNTLSTSEADLKVLCCLIIMIWCHTGCDAGITIKLQNSRLQNSNIEVSFCHQGTKALNNKSVMFMTVCIFLTICSLWGSSPECVCILPRTLSASGGSEWNPGPGWIHTPTALVNIFSISKNGKRCDYFYTNHPSPK